MSRCVSRALGLGFVLGVAWLGRASGDEPIPYRQTEPPGPALSPDEAIARMTMPQGFHVELVAAEPDLVNPVAMTFDERGRIWVTESLEYPRSEPGVGRDRVKVLEDTDGDGKADSFTIFAEGLNIPSGIAVGHGGVWVANAPDILFLQDTDGDGKADRREVVVTGFGRDDTHELPNSLTWGPDGWLYGWNGVFNQSLVRHRGKEFRFTCAIFRIHPKTRAFEVWCEGTSNPWGITFDLDGSTFASACVIDHLWHLVESGYYHRQGGPYPPFVWKLGSIVDHLHQKAAYCNIQFFDSDAYPEPFRERLYMGNIHGNCVNVDTLERHGATYRAEAAPDFLKANDAWFMPVAQKVGPDGCLYILDWYDRYHCYQDARRDPEGIDRLKGRLYRVRYGDAPRTPAIDMAGETDDRLIDRLGSPNIHIREVAQRLLAERADPASGAKLRRLVLDGEAPRKARMHALWAMIGSGPLEPLFHLRVLAHADPAVRAWGVRAAGNEGRVDGAVAEAVVSLASDPAPEVRLQVAIAARKLEGVDPLPLLVEVASRSGDDPIIPNVAWQNLHPLLEVRGAAFLRRVEALPDDRLPALREILPRVVERLLGARAPDLDTIASLIEGLAGGRIANDRAASKALATLGDKILAGEIDEGKLTVLRERLAPMIRSRLEANAKGDRLRPDAALLAATWNDPDGLAETRRIFAPGGTGQTETTRLRALDVLIASDQPEATMALVARSLTDHSGGSADFRGKVLAALGRLDEPRVAELILKSFPELEPALRPKAIEVLTQRPVWGGPLLRAIDDGRIAASDLNANQVRKLQSGKDSELNERARKLLGTVRETRDPTRDQYVTRMKAMLVQLPGDPFEGRQVFNKVCAQCHKIYGEGVEVGPDLTGIGRTDFDQLVSNVFDPSLVIGPAYQATMVATADGRVLSGLLVEDTPRQVVLKTQGGKLETIARDEVDAIKVSPISLMPEDLEKQFSPQELADLFAFLALDKPPTDPEARRLPGAPAHRIRSPRAEARP